MSSSRQRYALTGDNMLKMIAIYFRVKAGCGYEPLFAVYLFGSSGF